MFVDDEQDILESMQLLMASELPTVDVVTAPSGPEALRLLESMPCDLVVTDYRMPGMDGPDLIEAIRKRWPATPTVMVTAYLDPLLWKETTARIPGLHIMGKPLDIAAFLAIVRETIPDLP